MKTNYRLFSLLSISLIFIAVLSTVILNTDEILINSLSDKLSQDQIDEILEKIKKFQWIGLMSIPIILLIKICLISSILYIGIHLGNLTTTFYNLIGVTIKAEFVFILVGISKLLYFVNFKEITMDQYYSFYPLSAINIVGSKGVSPWFIYPLQVLNLFELAYWFVLAYLLGKELKISMDKGFKIVASSYGTALLIWVVAVMFLTLNYS